MSRQEIKQYYNQLKKSGPYGTLAPHNKGGLKSQYVATIFDEAVLPYFTDARNDKVLDFGCAGGILSNKLAPLTALTIGVDMTEGMLEIAKEPPSGSNALASYVQIDGQRLPFKDAKFDSAVTRETLFYINDEDFPVILDEIRRVLKVDGYFYVLEQVSDSPYWQRERNRFLTRRSHNETKAQFKQKGFECIEEYVVRHPRSLWTFLFWFGLFPKKLMRPIAKLEIQFNRRFLSPKTNRYLNVLFIFRKSK